MMSEDETKALSINDKVKPKDLIKKKPTYESKTYNTEFLIPT
jgi:hypothetical protein